MLRPEYKRAPGEQGVDVPTAIGAEEVHMIAQKDKVGGATFFYEMSKPDNSLPTPKCPLYSTEYDMTTNPIFTRLMRHAHDIVLVGSVCTRILRGFSSKLDPLSLPLARISTGHP